MNHSSSPSTPRALLFSFLLLSLMAVVVLLFLEAAFRFFPQPDFLASIDRSPSFFTIAPQQEHPWSRNAENPLRIAVMGDSFSKGDGNQIYDRYGERLEHLLNMNSHSPPAEVRNYSKSGRSTYQELKILPKALSWKPDIVILGICLNDTEDMTRFKTLEAWRREKMPKPPSPRLVPILSRSRFFSWVYGRKENWRARRGYLRYYERIYDPGYSGWKRFTSGMRQFRDRVNEAESRLLAVVIPLMSEDFDVGRYPFEKQHDQIRRFLRQEGIDHHDLIDDFRGKSPERMQAVPRIDPHPSEIAHRIIAESIFAYLLRNSWIDPSYKPSIAGNNGTIHRNWLHTGRRLQATVKGGPVEKEAPAP